MTTARLTEIAFDKKHFPLSPHTNSYEASVMRGYPASILIRADGDFRLLNTFSDALKNFAELPGFKRGDYKMFITMAGGDDDPEIVFQVRSKKTSHIVASKEMSQQKFLGNYDEAFSEWLSSKSMQKITDDDLRLFETEWSIDYLKSEVFGDMIKGSREFWERLHNDLDVALVPVNLKMKLAAEGYENSIVQIEPRYDQH